jgi:hypothetical protein
MPSSTTKKINIYKYKYEYTSNTNQRCHQYHFFDSSRSKATNASESPLAAAMW